MRIKKDIYHIMFFDLFFEIIFIILVAFGFFLGFEITTKSVLIYLSINFCFLLLGIAVYCSYSLSCKTYYEFRGDSIAITKKGNVIKQINNNQIISCEYYGFVELLLGNTKGGKLVVCYLDNDIPSYMEISCSRKMMERIKLTSKSRGVV